MSQTTPHRPRHALREEPDLPTTALPSGTALFTESTGFTESTAAGSEYTDDATCLIPVIPAQRTGSAPVPQVYPVPDSAAEEKPSRRVLPAVLAGVTALLLAAGVAVGLGGGAAVTDPSGPPSSSGTP